MSTLNFSPTVKVFNMTPFKFSVCCLIHSFLKDKELSSRYNILVLLDGIKLLVNEISLRDKHHYLVRAAEKDRFRHMQEQQPKRRSCRNLRLCQEHLEFLLQIGQFNQ